MLKNPCKATGLNHDSHDCSTNVKCIQQKGWLARLVGYKVSLAGLFQHIFLTNKRKFAKFRMQNEK